MNRSFYLKTKVLLGFGLVLSAIVLASVIAYHSYEQLSRAVQTLSRQDTRLQQIDSILVIVSNSENHLQEYMIEKSPKKLQKYDSLVSNVRQRVQQLKTVSTVNNTKLDSILILINAKLVSMNKFMEIRERRDDFRFYDEALKQLAQKANNEKPVPPREKQSEAKPETSAVDRSEQADINNREQEQEEEKEKGWFKRIIDRLWDNGEPPEDEPATDSLKLAETEVLPEEDTLFQTEQETPNLSVDSVRQMLLKLKSEQAATEQYLNQQELDYLSTNAQVMNRIHDMVAGVKHQRQTEYTRQSQEARDMLRSSLSRLGVILVIALCSTILFVYLIFADIAKSDFLKRQLEMAKEKAEQLAKVKEDFLANMSHEIRTPLTAILGFSGFLKKTLLNSKQQEYVSAVSSSSSHLLSLVNDILDFSKIEAGQLRFETEPFDINLLVQQLCIDMRLQAEKKDLQLIAETERNGLCFVKGDAFRLRQVLYNLISNAIKFTEEGGVIVRARLKELNDEYVSAQLQVIDSGIGIPKEKQQHIFDAFVQSDVSDTRKYGGTGLGLSISKKIIETQGGEIALESTPGEGTTFYIALPYRKSSEEEALAVEQHTQPNLRFPGLRMLVIDDDPLNTQLLSLMVKKWEVSCLLARSGKEGLEMLKNHTIDLILTDLQMPEMHGEEVAKTIREMGHSVPIVAFTARVTLQEDYFQDKGFQGVLHKPFHDHDVLQMLRHQAPSFAESVEVSESKHNVNNNGESTESALYSLENIRRFIGDDQQALCSFMENFLKVLREAIEKMDVAIHDNDTQSMGYYAHKLYPNIAQLGVDKLAQLLRGIENDARSEQPAAISKDDISYALVLCQELEKALGAHLKSLKAEVS